MYIRLFILFDCLRSEASRTFDRLIELSFYNYVVVSFLVIMITFKVIVSLILAVYRMCKMDVITRNHRHYLNGHFTGLTGPPYFRHLLWNITFGDKFFMILVRWCHQCCKGKERKSIYIAPFVYYVYLKALRHGSHSFTCKYTMSVHQMAFPLTELTDVQLQLTTHLSTPKR